MTPREQVLDVFNSSAAMPGNERAFEAALDAFEDHVRAAQTAKIVKWLHAGAPTAAKWVREQFGAYPA